MPMFKVGDRVEALVNMQGLKLGSTYEVLAVLSNATPGQLHHLRAEGRDEAHSGQQRPPGPARRGVSVKARKPETRPAIILDTVTREGGVIAAIQVHGLVTHGGWKAAQDAVAKLAADVQFASSGIVFLDELKLVIRTPSGRPWGSWEAEEIRAAVKRSAAELGIDLA
jgi:hypothetical protein